MIWGRASLIIFAVSFDGMPDLGGSLMTLLAPENLGLSSPTSASVRCSPG